MFNVNKKRMKKLKIKNDDEVLKKKEKEILLIVGDNRTKTKVTNLGTDEDPDWYGFYTYQGHVFIVHDGADQCLLSIDSSTANQLVEKIKKNEFEEDPSFQG